jgi:hypothetical protein
MRFLTCSLVLACGLVSTASGYFDGLYDLQARRALDFGSLKARDMFDELEARDMLLSRLRARDLDELLDYLYERDEILEVKKTPFNKA